MAKKTILSANQKKLLAIIAKSSQLTDSFYLTGGTALAEYYLQHRLSEDLDFFSETEFNPADVYGWWQGQAKKLGIKKIKAETSFNRNLFFLTLADGDMIKTEFTYFPFTRLEKLKKQNGLQIDSLLDIAVNKLFTIYQRSRARDYIDLYLLCQQEKFKIKDLIKLARLKFDWHIDYLQLGSQFLSARQATDLPRMLIDLQEKIWQEFFIKEAEKLKDEVLK